jgi:DNA-binding NarL/FixJ family response regulator
MPSAKLIHVLLVDDRSAVRLELWSILQSYPNIEIVGEAADGEEALLKVGQFQPTVVVMDINMPKMDGITATRLIKAQHSEIVILGLTVEAKDYQIYAMLKAGASEVLKKDQAVNALYGAIQRAVAAVQPILILEESPASEEAPTVEKLREQFREPQADIVAIDESIAEPENTDAENT